VFGCFEIVFMILNDLVMVVCGDGV